MMMMMRRTTTPILAVAAIVLACLSFDIEAFSPSASSRVSTFTARGTNNHPSLVILHESESSDESSSSSSEDQPKTEKISLEEKMKSWEASEEELKAASLGGVIPQPRERTEAFDIGLYIAFPIMVLTGLAFAFFPFIMGNIDVSNIEVPRE